MSAPARDGTSAAPTSAGARSDVPEGGRSDVPAGRRPRVPAGSRVVVAFLAGRTAFGLAHLAGAARDWPIPWYQPIDRAFLFGPRPAGFAMEWYGRSLASFTIAAVVTAAFWLLSARGPLAGALRRKAFVLSLAQAAALALIVDFAYFGWVFLTQAAQPLPLPPGCVP